MLNSSRNKDHKMLIKTIASLISLVVLFENIGYPCSDTSNNKTALRPPMAFSEEKRVTVSTYVNRELGIKGKWVIDTANVSARIPAVAKERLLWSFLEVKEYLEKQEKSFSIKRICIDENLDSEVVFIGENKETAMVSLKFLRQESNQQKEHILEAWNEKILSKEGGLIRKVDNLDQNVRVLGHKPRIAILAFKNSLSDTNKAVSLAAYSELVNKGFDIRAEFNNDNFANSLKDFSPDIIFIDVFVNEAKVLRTRIVRIREAFPNAKIILFGQMAMSIPGLALSYFDADGLIRGDIEKIAPELLAILNKAWNGEYSRKQLMEELLKYEGVYISLDDITVSSNTEDINKLSKEEYEALQIDYALFHNFKVNGYSDIEVFTSKGCPFSCIYCLLPEGRRFVPKSVEKVIDELWQIKRNIDEGRLKQGARNVVISDENFTVDPDRAIEIIQKIKEEGLDKYLNIKIALASIDTFFIRRDGKRIVNRKLIKAIKSLVQEEPVTFGTDGFSDRVLRQLHKFRYTIGDLEALLQAFEEEGLITKHNVLLYNMDLTLVDYYEELLNLALFSVRYPNFYTPNFNEQVAIYAGSTSMAVLRQRGWMDKVKVSYDVPSAVIGGQEVEFLDFAFPEIGDYSPYSLEEPMLTKMGFRVEATDTIIGKYWESRDKMEIDLIKALPSDIVSLLDAMRREAIVELKKEQDMQRSEELGVFLEKTKDAAALNAMFIDEIMKVINSKKDLGERLLLYYFNQLRQFGVAYIEKDWNGTYRTCMNINIKKTYGDSDLVHRFLNSQDAIERKYTLYVLSMLENMPNLYGSISWTLRRIAEYGDDMEKILAINILAINQYSYPFIIGIAKDIFRNGSVRLRKEMVKALGAIKESEIAQLLLAQFKQEKEEDIKIRILMAFYWFKYQPALDYFVSIYNEFPRGQQLIAKLAIKQGHQKGWELILKEIEKIPLLSDDSLILFRLEGLLENLIQDVQSDKFDERIVPFIHRLLINHHDDNVLLLGSRLAIKTEKALGVNLIDSILDEIEQTKGKKKRELVKSFYDRWIVKDSSMPKSVRIHRNDL